MALSANAEAAPAAAPPVPPSPKSDFAETQALIKQITAEARGSGRSIDFDPDAPADDAGDGEASESADAADADDSDAATPAKGSKAKPKKETDNEDAGEGDEGDEELGDEGDEGDEGQQGHSIRLLDVQKALSAKGGVDLLALAEALGVQPEALKLTPGQAKAMRIERRKTQQTLDRAVRMSKELEEKYGDQVKARAAAGEGDLQPAIEFIESTFGMGWNELNKMIADLLQGKPATDLDQRRELRQLKQREAQREKEQKEREAAQAKQERIGEAKKWIKSSIKGDKLADAALEQQLQNAGMPTVVDMVFEEMQAHYSEGLTDPKKALERVKAKLTRHARALQAAGVLPKTKTSAAPKNITASPPRESAQTGSAGNGRPMSDAELRHAVLKEAGLLRK